MSTASFAGPLIEGTVPSETALAAVEAHPGFDQAAASVAAGSVAGYRGNRLVNAVMTDRARLLMAMWILYFHFSSRRGDPSSGLTLARVRRACTDLDVCSRQRVEAMIVLMRFFGHLAVAPHPEDRLLHRLVPTDRLLEWNRWRLANSFEALAKVMPEGLEALSRLETPGFIESVSCHLGRIHLAGFRIIDHAPDMRLFFERNAGLVTLMSMCLSAESERFPPTVPIHYSLSALARSFGVSRTHLRRMFDDAQKLELLERSGPDALRILPRLEAGLRRGYALYLLYHAHCVRAALADQRESAWPEASRA
jgi:AraC-like DNA-binding protein